MREGGKAAIAQADKSPALYMPRKAKGWGGGHSSVCAEWREREKREQSEVGPAHVFISNHITEGGRRITLSQSVTKEL